MTVYFLNFEELETELDDLQERDARCKEYAEEIEEWRVRCAGANVDERPEDDTDPLDEDETDRKETLEKLLSDLGGTWPDGAGIEESGFKEYAQDRAEDIHGDLGPMSQYIDWDQYAEDAQSDYNVVKFDGDTYYYQR